MAAAVVMIVFVLTAAVLQMFGFVISRVVDYQWPTAGLLTFLLLFLAAYGFAWPIAVRITEWGLTRAGIPLQPSTGSEQST